MAIPISDDRLEYLSIIARIVQAAVHFQKCQSALARPERAYPLDGFNWKGVELSDVGFDH